MGLFKLAVLAIVGAAVISFITSFFQPDYPVPKIFGTVSPGFEEVAEVFRENFELDRDKNEGGSAFAVYYKGEQVVDLWAGYADQEAKLLWKEDTMSLMYSTTKGLSALVIAMLADRGLIDFTKPIVKYWPEFAQNGKEKITVEMLLEHEAGLPIVHGGINFDILRDKEARDKVLALSEPLWEPGTAHGYHALSFGLFTDALVRRVDKKNRTLGQFFAEEVAEPFALHMECCWFEVINEYLLSSEIDAFIGTPKDKYYRLSRTVHVQPSPADIIRSLTTSQFYRKIFVDLLFGSPSSALLIDVMKNCGEVCEWDRHVDPDIISLEFPAANGMGTARSLAKLFGIMANGGEHDGKTLISGRFLDEYKYDRRQHTPDKVLWELPIRWKYGMQVIPEAGQEMNIFGSAGYGGQFGFADPNRSLGYGFLSRYMSPTGFGFLDPRAKFLLESVLRAVKKIETQS